MTKQTTTEDQGRNCLMPLRQNQLRKLHSIAAAISALIKECHGDTPEACKDEAVMEKIAGLYDCTLHLIEDTNSVPEGRAAFELGYLVAKRNRCTEFAASIAAHIWPDDVDLLTPGETKKPSDDTIERIKLKIEALISEPA